MRKFSIPYNRINVDDYVDLLKSYSKDKIDNIYLSIPEIDEHLYDEDESDISKEFLEKTKEYKRIVVYNYGVYNYSDDEFYKHLDESIFPLVEKYRIDGFIVTNLNVSRYIHKNYPDLELHLSCNNPVYTVRQAEMWFKEAGITLFNPPREIARTIPLLKEFHEHGFKLKVLLNSTCMYGCPYQMNHTCANGLNLDLKFNCAFSDLVNSLKTNVILPEWMSLLDEYVDIYKIAGRKVSLSQLKSTLDVYINGKKAKHLTDFSLGCALNNFDRIGLKIPVELVPRKLIACECKDCNSCSVCEEALKKIIQYNIEHYEWYDENDRIKVL